ncbi:MAG: hypothetical protein LWW93_07615 [Hyphomicrobiales bacterium]|nr:hypothetical protein [Hyphomicrobiales bacterium]
MKVIIATPVYGETISTGTHVSVLDAIRFFAREFPHIGFTTHVLSTSFFPMARNVLASLFLAEADATHLLFVDPDMSFSPELVAKMLAFGKPVVGAIYPDKAADFDAFRRAMQRSSNTLQGQLQSVRYVYDGDAIVGRVGKDGKREVDVVDGFVRVTRAGAGLLLIAREAFETIQARMPEMWIPEPKEWLRTMGLSEGCGYIQCFDMVPGEDGSHTGSDIAFSDRWVKGCGGEIWSCVDEAIIRIGAHNYVGHYLTHLQANAGDQMVLNYSSSRAEA